MFETWRKYHTAPYHFPMSEEIWAKSMYSDIDSDGRKLFSELYTNKADHGIVQYGYSAFGFDESGDISEDVHYPIIRLLAFDPAYPEDGSKLLRFAMDYFQGAPRVYAFFHYFGMSVCARHGKLHEAESHVASLLAQNGFVVEHENVYYKRDLLKPENTDNRITLNWKPLSNGNCREFAAIEDGQEIGWGQIHFLPQKDIAYLRWIFIDDKRQHTGLGTAVMKQLINELYAMGIRRFDTDTALDNNAAQGYYEKTGFTNAGITRSYYTK